MGKGATHDTPAKATSDQVIVLGNVQQARVDELLKQMDKAIEAAARHSMLPQMSRWLRGDRTFRSEESL